MSKTEEKKGELSRDEKFEIERQKAIKAQTD